jgi:hypothetical protein
MVRAVIACSQSAERAIAAMNGAVHFGRRVTVGYAEEHVRPCT